MIAAKFAALVLITACVSNGLVDGWLFGQREVTKEKSGHAVVIATNVEASLLASGPEMENNKRVRRQGGNRPVDSGPAPATTTTFPQTTSQRKVPTPLPDCEWAEWNSWAKCDCRLGTQVRNRKFKKAPNDECFIRGCGRDLRACPRANCPIDCVYTKWSSWTECGGKCGEGNRKRTRSIRVPALYGGKKCKRFEEKERCEVSGDHCSQTRDCDYAPWSSWGECRSRSPHIPCDCSSNEYGYGFGGFHIRERLVVGHGYNCQSTQETRQCRLSCCDGYGYN